MEPKKSICDSFLFRGIPQDTAEALLCDIPAAVAVFAPGETLYSAESDAKMLGFLQSGAADVLRRGSDVILNRLSAGDAFGVASLFGSLRDFPTDVVATKRTECLFFSEEAVTALLSRSPAVTQNYIRFLSDKIRFLNERIASFSAKSAEGKLAAFLLSQERDASVAVGSFTAAAKKLSLGRASFYRALASLTEAGAITRDGNQILIQNKNILERIQNQ